MKYLLLSLSLLAIIGCKQNETGNKMILPATEDNVMRLDSEHGSHAEHATHDQEATEHDEHAQNTTEKLDADGNYVYEVGALGDIELPNGVKLHVGDMSSESKLFKQLSDAGFAVSEDKTQGWITLDRVYFKTNSNQLTLSSEEQLKNIAELLKAFPTAEVKLGGYTDNTGSQEINQPLSDKRAASVKAQLEGLGVEANRLASEGYGSEHPICPANDTDECRAQNRRVDVRIVKK